MHTSKSASRRHRRKLATGWLPPSPDDPLPPVTLIRRGQTVTIERTHGSPRRDLFAYDGHRLIGLTTIALFQGYRFP